MGNLWRLGIKIIRDSNWVSLTASGHVFVHNATTVECLGGEG